MLNNLCDVKSKYHDGFVVTVCSCGCRNLAIKKHDIYLNHAIKQLQYVKDWLEGKEWQLVVYLLPQVVCTGASENQLAENQYTKNQADQVLMF